MAAIYATSGSLFTSLFRTIMLCAIYHPTCCHAFTPPVPVSGRCFDRVLES